MAVSDLPSRDDVADVAHANSDAAPAAAPAAWWETLVDNRERQFWVLQLIGWGGWGTAGAIAWAYWKADPINNLLFFVDSWIAIALTAVLRYVYRAVWSAQLPARIAVALLASYVFAGLWQLGKNAMSAWAFGYDLVLFPTVEQMESYSKPGVMGFFTGIMNSFYIMLCWTGLYFGIKWYQLLQSETAKVLRLSAMAHQAQLKMLRYQLNPHFLFNTLNAISTLVMAERNEVANHMVTRLADFLRYSLDSDPMQKVSLNQEVHALRLYLDIEQVRFDDRLKFAVDIDEAAGSAMVPSLILQPLVENAIKYAVARSESGGTIELHARRTERGLVIELMDDGPGLDSAGSSGNGVGLANTRDRLAEVYGEDHAFALEPRSPTGLTVRIELPFETMAHAEPARA